LDDRIQRSARRRVLFPPGPRRTAAVPLPLGVRRRRRARALPGKARGAAPPAGSSLRDFEIPALPQSGPPPRRPRGPAGGSTVSPRDAVSLAAVALAFAGLYVRALDAPSPAGFVAPHASTAVASAPLHRAELLPNSSAQSVHSATAIELGDGGLRAFWYGGTR